MAYLFLGLGLVAVIEGLVLALAPSRLDDLLEKLQQFSLENRRAFGLKFAALGAALIWLARYLGV